MSISLYKRSLMLLLWLFTSTACQIIPTPYDNPRLIIPDWDKLTEAQKQAIMNNYVPKSEYYSPFYYSPSPHSYYNSYWGLEGSLWQTEHNSAHRETAERDQHWGETPNQGPSNEPPAAAPPSSSIECGAGSSCKQFKLR